MKVPPVRWRQKLSENGSSGQSPALRSRTQNLAAIRGIEKRASENTSFFSSAPDDVSDAEDRAEPDFRDLFTPVAIGTSISSMQEGASSSAAASATGHTVQGVGASEGANDESWCTFIKPPPRPLSSGQRRPMSGRPDFRNLRRPDGMISGPPPDESTGCLVPPKSGDVQCVDLGALVSAVLQEKSASGRPSSALGSRSAQNEDKRRLISGRQASPRAEQKRPASALILSSRPPSATQRPKMALSARGPRRPPPCGFSAGAPALPGGGARTCR